jgi:hypothetical protein
MKKNFLRRALSGASVAAITLGGTLFLVAGPAQAFTCAHSANHSLTNSTGVSHANFTVSYGCSDGKLHWSGTLYDDKCDSRAARISIYSGFIESLGDQWEWSANAGNGCGTHSTFSGSDPAPNDGEITVDVYAANFYGDSSDQFASYSV